MRVKFKLHHQMLLSIKTDICMLECDAVFVFFP